MVEPMEFLGHGGGSTTAWDINVNTTIVNGGYDWVIRDNTFEGGINIGADSSAHGVVDGLNIIHNNCNNASTSTNPCIQVAQGVGAGNLYIANNRGGLLGGAVVIKQATDPMLENNQFEQPTGTGTPGGCMVEFITSFGEILNPLLLHNNLNDTSAGAVVCLHDTTSARLEDNTINVPSGKTGITATAGATIIPAENVFSGSGSSGIAATCTSTGLGTGNCTMLGVNFMHSSVVLNPAGTPSSSGIVTITWPISIGSTTCPATLRNRGGSWDLRATVRVSTTTGTTCY